MTKNLTNTLITKIAPVILTTLVSGELNADSPKIPYDLNENRSKTYVDRFGKRHYSNKATDLPDGIYWGNRGQVVIKSNKDVPESGEKYNYPPIYRKYSSLEWNLSPRYPHHDQKLTPPNNNIDRPLRVKRVNKYKCKNKSH